MSLYKEWTRLAENQTQETFEAFWEEYATTEKKIYQHILATYPEKFSGSINEIAEKFEAKPVFVMGFCDGINDSLNVKHELKDIEADTVLELDIDFEKLFFNMLKAEADYLYTLEEWSNVYDNEKLMSIVKEYKASKTVHVEKKPGRNDPCPCGSGKKYKKCCGANK